MLLEFKEAITILSSLLCAGYSLENSVKEAVTELTVLYGKEALIVKEFEYIDKKQSMNIPVEVLFYEFGRRSGIEDIKNFSNIIKIAKRSGGQLVYIINYTVNILSEKIRIKEEIATITASKRFEQRIMNIFPIIIILYINISSPDFFKVMYSTILGRFIMSIILCLYAFSIKLSEKILDIEV